MQGKVDLSFLVPKFLERLDERLRRIDAALETVVDASGEPLETVMRDFHSLAGIGGTYGFPEVTRLAREGELLLQRAISERRHVRTGEAAAAHVLVTEMDSIRMRAAA